MDSYIEGRGYVLARMIRSSMTLDRFHSFALASSSNRAYASAERCTSMRRVWRLSRGVLRHFDPGGFPGTDTAYQGHLWWANINASTVAERFPSCFWARRSSFARASSDSVSSILRRFRASRGMCVLAMAGQ